MNRYVINDRKRLHDLLDVLLSFRAEPQVLINRDCLDLTKIDVEESSELIDNKIFSYMAFDFYLVDNINDIMFISEGHVKGNQELSLEHLLMVRDVLFDNRYSLGNNFEDTTINEYFPDFPIKNKRVFLKQRNK